MLSVLMTVYEKENADYFRASLQSIEKQTLAADEVILVKDGPLNAPLEEVIKEFSSKLPITTVPISWSGCWKALQVGVEASRGDLIARMDSDDVCMPQRFMVQAQAMRSHPNIDVLGGAITEFIVDPMRSHSVRRLPRRHKQITAYAKRRNPVNHVSVMYRRDAVLRAGNYQYSPGFEDWHLRNRMMHAGSRFMNLDEVLVLVRVGNGMLKRRSGLQYIKHEVAFHRDMYNSDLLSLGQLVRSLMLRLPIRLAPEGVIRTVYSKALRSEG